MSELTETNVIPIDKNATPVAPPVDERMLALKKEASQILEASEGFILFAFKIGDASLPNGQQIKVAKTMLPDAGAIGGGEISLPYILSKVQLLVKQEHDAQDAQRAKLSE